MCVRVCVCVCVSVSVCVCVCVFLSIIFRHLFGSTRLYAVMSLVTSIKSFCIHGSSLATADIIHTVTHNAGHPLRDS